MNFKNMEYFITVVSEGSVSKAAEVLNLSQQALSNSIARLEQELGCALFDRKQNMNLTYSGKWFLESCNQILDLKRQTLLAIDDINGSSRGELRIGIGHTRGQAILPLILPKFSSMYPNVEIEVIEDTSRVLEDYLLKGRIDILIGFGPFFVEGAVYHELMKENLSIVVSDSLLEKCFPGHVDEVIAQYEKTTDIRLFRNVPFILLSKGDRIRTMADNVFRFAGVRPTVRLETSNIQTALALAGEGMGMTISPDIYLDSPYVFSANHDRELKRKVRCFHFRKVGISDTIAIGYNKDRYLCGFAKDFIRMALEMFHVEDELKDPEQ